MPSQSRLSAWSPRSCLPVTSSGPHSNKYSQHAFWLIYRKMVAEERYGQGGFRCMSLNCTTPCSTAHPLSHYRRRKRPVRAHICAWSTRLRLDQCLICMIAARLGVSIPPVCLVSLHMYTCCSMIYTRYLLRVVPVSGQALPPLQLGITHGHQRR